MKTVTFDNICEHIPDLEEKINNKLIKVIPLKRSSKAPKDNAWNTKDYSLTTLKKHKGNFGIIPGFNHTDCSLAIVDIDGYTIETEDKRYKEQIKKQTADYIYDCTCYCINNSVLFDSATACNKKNYCKREGNEQTKNQERPAQITHAAFSFEFSYLIHNY